MYFGPKKVPIYVLYGPRPLLQRYLKKCWGKHVSQACVRRRGTGSKTLRLLACFGIKRSRILAGLQAHTKILVQQVTSFQVTNISPRIQRPCPILTAQSSIGLRIPGGNLTIELLLWLYQGILKPHHCALGFIISAAIVLMPNENLRSYY